MTMHKPTTLGLGPHAPKPAVANRNRAIAQANYAAAQDTIVPVLVAELRAHGHMGRACAAIGTTMILVQTWRKRDPVLDASVKLAVQFAESDGVDYGKWTRAQ